MGDVFFPSVRYVGLRLAPSFDQFKLDFIVPIIGDRVANDSGQFSRVDRLERIQFDARPHPCCRWMAGNVSLETDAADNWKPSKKKSTERIDGIVAAIMAVGLAMLEPGPRWSIFYDSHDLEFG